MHFSFSLAVALTLACTATATLAPAHSNSKGKKPTKNACSETKKSDDIQAAECGHNTRTHEKQTYAVFVVDHSKDKNHGAPYGTCYAYCCSVPTEFEHDDDSWVFFWTNDGNDKHGPGTGCIKDSQTGECGCENSDGQFIAGSDSCK